MQTWDGASETEQIKAGQPDLSEVTTQIDNTTPFSAPNTLPTDWSHQNEDQFPIQAETPKRTITRKGFLYAIGVGVGVLGSGIVAKKYLPGVVSGITGNREKDVARDDVEWMELDPSPETTIQQQKYEHELQNANDPQKLIDQIYQNFTGALVTGDMEEYRRLWYKPDSPDILEDSRLVYEVSSTIQNHPGYRYEMTGVLIREETLGDYKHDELPEERIILHERIVVRDRPEGETDVVGDEKNIVRFKLRLTPVYLESDGQLTETREYKIARVEYVDSVIEVE